MTEVTEKKNHDYSVRLDAMDNFKLIGEMLGISPTLVWSVLWMKHVTAVINHMAQGKTLKSEDDPWTVHRPGELRDAGRRSRAGPRQFTS